jgi:hypothetical protein
MATGAFCNAVGAGMVRGCSCFVQLLDLRVEKFEEKVNFVGGGELAIF